MSWNVSLRQAAELDLAQACAWYDQQRLGLGDEFLAGLAETLIRLEKAPELHPVYYRGFRRILARRFPYKVFYRIERESVIVFRILHVARDHARQLDQLAGP